MGGEISEFSQGLEASRLHSCTHFKGFLCLFIQIQDVGFNLKHNFVK